MIFRPFIPHVTFDFVQSDQAFPRVDPLKAQDDKAFSEVRQWFKSNFMLQNISITRQNGKYIDEIFKLQIRRWIDETRT